MHIPEELRKRFTKQEYLKTLVSPYHFHKWILGNPIELSKPQKDVLRAVATYPEVEVIAGAKGGKSTLSADVATWMVYRLLCLPTSPVEHYHLTVGSNTYVMNIAPQEGLALNIVLNYIRGLVEGSWYLSRFVVGHHRNDLEFIDSIFCRAQGSSSTAGLGYAIFGLVLDEVCHFRDTTGPMAGSVVYNNYTPRLLPFGMDGRLMAISTPAGRQGVGYDMFSKGKPMYPYMLQSLPTQGEYTYRAVFQLPTWKLNPLFQWFGVDDPRSHPFLVKMYKNDPFFFEMEFGAKFADVVAAFFNLKALENVKEMIAFPQKDHEHNYIITHDPSMYRDAYAVAMGHMLDDGRVRVDYVQTFKPNPDKDEPVSITAVEDHIVDMCKRYNVSDVIGDETRSASTIASLANKGVPSRALKYGSKSDLRFYQPLLEMVNTKGISIVPDEALFQELRFLERVQMTDRYRVQAAPGNTDDLADCVAMLNYVFKVENADGGGRLLYGR